MELSDMYRRIYLGRIIFTCKIGSINYENWKITSFENNEVKFNDNLFSKVLIDKNIVTIAHKTFYRNQTRIFFLKESDAIRYCKSQLFKALKVKENDAKLAIRKLKDFKEANWEYLQNDYTEKNIRHIESQYKF